MGRLILLPVMKALGWFFAVQPALIRSWMGRSLGAVLRLARLRAKVVDQNLDIAFPALVRGSDERALLFRQAYEHLGFLFWEILMLFGPMKRFVRRRARLLGLQHWIAADARGKGVIFLSSHVGNWEVMAANGALNGGMNVLIVTKKLKPEWLHRAIEHGRARCGVSGTYEPRTMRDVLSHLKRKGTIGLVLDQYAGAPIGVRVPFFGVPVGTANVVALLAKRTGAPVLPVLNYRTPEGRYLTEIQAPLEWIEDPNPHRELARNTALYAEVLEGHVRRFPGQWLWIHRRFKGDLGPLHEGEWESARARR